MKEKLKNGHVPKIQGLSLIQIGTYTAAAATSGRFNYKAGFSTAQLSGTVKANRMASSAVDSLAFIT